MFNYDELTVESKASLPAKSDSEIKSDIRDMGFRMIFPDGITEDFVRTDTGKICYPFDYEGKIRWIEISFVAKNEDYNPSKDEEKCIEKMKRINDRMEKAKNNREKKIKELMSKA